MVNFSARFRTKDTNISIPDTVYSLNGNLGPKELSNLIKTVYKGTSPDTDSLSDGIRLSFIIDDRLLRSNLVAHFQEETEDGNEAGPIDEEKVLEIEYFINQKAPIPINSCSTDDWISCIDTNEAAIINGCYDGTVNIWKIGKFDQLISIPAHASAVKDVKWIPRQQMVGFDNLSENDYFFVTTSNDETVCVWKINLNEEKVDQIYLCKGHTRSVDCVDIQDDIFATGSYDALLKIWSLYDKEKPGDENEPVENSTKKFKTSDKEETDSSCKVKTPIMTLADHSEAISDLCFIRDSTDISKQGNLPTIIVTCSMDNTIKLWDVELGKVDSTLSGSKAFLSISYSPMKKCLISGSCDRHIRLWDPRSSEGSIVKSVFTSHQGWITSVNWSPTNENLFISGSYDAIVKQWDIRSNRGSLYDLIGHEDKVLSTDWSNPKYIVSGSADKHLKIYQNEC
ncbi:ribosome biogenesis protein WDR12 homolog [Tetranychus urticae]|uniref:Ribosome biogenesis protein WDR12 homolog n=1 Tax=Tetranychus urticae TaxID=32264 RepID=T1L303_TETUR|nr:ribosome biogenesis protein WDR12 homolog [Tetranychus urticae]